MELMPPGAMQADEHIIDCVFIESEFYVVIATNLNNFFIFKSTPISTSL